MLDIKEALKNVVTNLGGTSTAKTVKGIINEIAENVSGSGGGGDDDDKIYIDINYDYRPFDQTASDLLSQIASDHSLLNQNSYYMRYHNYNGPIVESVGKIEMIRDNEGIIGCLYDTGCYYDANGYGMRDRIFVYNLSSNGGSIIDRDRAYNS